MVFIPVSFSWTQSGRIKRREREKKKDIIAIFKCLNVVGNMRTLPLDVLNFYTHLFTLSGKYSKLIKMLDRRVSASFQNVPLSSLPHFKKESG